MQPNPDVLRALGYDVQVGEGGDFVSAVKTSSSPAPKPFDMAVHVIPLGMNYVDSRAVVDFRVMEVPELSTAREWRPFTEEFSLPLDQIRLAP